MVTIDLSWLKLYVSGQIFGVNYYHYKMLPQQNQKIKYKITLKVIVYSVIFIVKEYFYTSGYFEKLDYLVKIKAWSQFYRKHILDIGVSQVRLPLRIKF